MKQISAQEEETTPKKKPVPIVAIGGSAGGMEAFIELLKHLSPTTGMSYVYIQHLDPTFESHLSSILSKYTQMPVWEANHLMHIEPNIVYVIPPNKSIEVIDGVLTLTPRENRPAIHLPIDLFFISLAERQKEGAIAVILSGNASDGTQGLKAIKMVGGITFAQDESAKFQSMPKSAIAEGVVDLVLPPAEIAQELERLGRQAPLLQEVMTADISNEENSERNDDSAERNEEMHTIIQLIKKSTGVDFSNYKVSTIRRRMIRRMLLHRLDTMESYAKYLRQHTAEVTLLYNDLLINVTRFFRDTETVDYLQNTLLPQLLLTKDNSNPLRVWIPACSTGEEVYSLAMLIIETLGERATNTAIQIFATDLSEAAINKARLGIYSQQEVAHVSERRLSRFFTKVNQHYRIVKLIRDLCVFAPHNVFKDPPFSRLDLISCCNLLIYVDTTLQKKIIATFHYALNKEGYLLLGRSETVGNSAYLFTQVDKKNKIYLRKGDRGGQLGLHLSLQAWPKERPVSPRRLTFQPELHIALHNDLEDLVNNTLLQQYTPASVVINQEMEIQQFRGSTSAFLEPATGKASLNLMKMARPGLAFELRNALRKCIKTGQLVRKTDLEVKLKDQVQLVSFEISPLLTESERLFLVIFEEQASPSVLKGQMLKVGSQKIKKLEEELLNTREDMRSIIEEQEASNEELQSANEEIVSSNEELQSINEELETSKEEIESSNEELMTINYELQARNKDLAEAYEYSEIIFNTIREAVVTLDRDFRVVSANQAYYQTFAARPEDTLGRLIYELGNQQWDIPELRGLLKDIIYQDGGFNGYEVKHNFHGVGQKVLAINGRKIMRPNNREQLLLLAIEDITEHRRAEQIVAEREIWFRQMSDDAPVMIWVAGTNQLRTFFNNTWLEFTSRTLEQEMGYGWAESVHPDDLERCMAIYINNFDARKLFRMEYRLRRHDGEYRWLLETGKPSYSPSGEFTGFIGTCTDIHEQKMLNVELDSRVKERTEELSKANTELVRLNDELQQFAYVASHDLQEPLRKISTFSNMLEKRFRSALPEDGLEYLDKMTAASRRMSLLIDDLLNFARTTRKESEFVNTDLNKIYENVILDFDLIISEQKAQLHIGPLPTIEAIPLQMTQLFRNLIGNALKFSADHETPTLTITSRLLSEEETYKYVSRHAPATYCELLFTDNGIGFPPEFAEQIFTIFKRLHDKQSYAGTGIGLALCRRIAVNHGGDIFAVSEEGQSAAFHVILPVVHTRAVDGENI